MPGNTIILAALISVFVLPQEPQSSLSLIDNSPPASPVMLYGTATPADLSATSETSYRAHVSIKNVSGKSILLMVTEINARGNGVNSDFRDIDDYFFKSQVFDPEAERTLETTIAPLKHARETRSGDSDLKLSIHIAFVQFVDGSTWGETRTGQEVMKLTERTFVLAILKALAVTYHTKGETAFISELMKPAQPVDIRLLQSLYTHENEPKAVMEKIEMMIRAAELHQQSIGKKDNGTMAR